MNELTQLSMIIVTWNGDGLLKNCLESLRMACGLAPEIVVVDNANLQSTKEIVAKYENAKYIASPDNLGFAGGNNLGLPYCTRPYVLLLNNDTVVHEEPFSRLIQYLKDHPGVAVVQGRLVLPKLGGVLDECGSYLTTWGWLYARYFRAPADTKVPTGPVFHAKGACLMFRKSVLEDLNGVLFHNHFRSYYEDVDFCHRVWIAGFEVHYVDTPAVDHLAGATATKLSSDEIVRRACANRLFSFRVNFGLRGKVLLLRYYLWQTLVMMWGVVKLHNSMKNYMPNFVLPPDEAKKVGICRRAVQSIRQVRDGCVFRRVLCKPSVRCCLTMLRGEDVTYVDAARMPK